VVRVLIQLRRTIRSHNADRVPAGWLWAAAVLGLITAAGTLWLGVADQAVPGAGADLLAFVFALWIGGQCGQAAMTGGDATMPPEMFALLPIRARSLARALLIAGLFEPVNVFLAVAFAALLALGAHSRLDVLPVAFVAWLLTILFTSASSSLAGTLLASGNRRGRDIATVATALVISAVAVAGTLLPTLATTLTDRSAPWLSTLVRVLPSGWGPVAVDAATRSDWPVVLCSLAGLCAATAVLAGSLSAALQRRMSGGATAHRRGRSGRTRRRVLPATATGAVIAREVRLWARDPIRLTCLLIALVVGAGAAAVPYLTAGTTLLLPFGGLLTVVIAGACACNLYGSDGTSIWVLVMTPGSSRPDVRGRQFAWLLIVAPWTVVVTVAFTAASGQQWAWPWVVALLVSLLGGGAGLAVCASVVNVLPMDDAGNPTPAWSIKVQLCLYLVALTGVPAATVLSAGALTGSSWIEWLAVPVGAVSASMLAWRLGALAVDRLAHRQVDILSRLTGSGAAPSTST
jgi:ABC-2 type transport system permease protein